MKKIDHKIEEPKGEDRIKEWHLLYSGSGIPVMPKPNWMVR
mgnify:CR=1 FL=1